MDKILVIDDDTKLLVLLSDYLTQNQFEVLTANSPDKGLRLLRSHKPAFIILDIMLPGMDGFEVCRAVRKFSGVPILMLTARGEVMDRVVGLEMGADDYLPKPFEPRELLARIKTILRRTDTGKDTPVIRHRNLEIDTDRRIVTLEGGVLNLTSLEYNLLEMFARRPGKTFSRNEIISHLQGADAEIFSRAVDIAVSRLRQKLRDSKSTQRFITTVWGTGYVFTGGG